MALDRDVELFHEDLCGMAPTMKARHFSTFMPFAVGIFRKPSQVQGLLLLQAQVPVARAVAEPRDQDVEDIGVQTNNKWHRIWKSRILVVWCDQRGCVVPACPIFVRILLDTFGRSCLSKACAAS